MASNGRNKPSLTITKAGAEALAPHIHHAYRALQCLAAMHAAARLPGLAKSARLAARKVAALQRQLDALSGSVPIRTASAGRQGADPARAGGPHRGNSHRSAATEFGEAPRSAAPLGTAPG